MDTYDNPPSSQSPPATHALRLTFAYRGNEIRLIDSLRIETITPPVVTPPPREGQSGYWFQVTDPSGTVVYHRPLHDPIVTHVEVFSREGQQTITRIPVARPEGRFSVLIPDLPEAADFSLLGPPNSLRPEEPARELVHLPVDELRKFRPTGAGQSE